jgi:hypothetical protein
LTSHWRSQPFFSGGQLSFLGGQPFAERLHCRKAILTLFSAGNQIPNRLAIQILVRKQGLVGYRRRDVSAKHHPPLRQHHPPLRQLSANKVGNLSSGRVKEKSDVAELLGAAYFLEKVSRISCNILKIIYKSYYTPRI